MAELVKNKLGLQVLTDTGWSRFDGVLVKGIRDTIILNIDGYSIACTPEHKIYVNETLAVPVTELVAGDVILTRAGPRSISTITKGKEETVYDLLNVEKNHRFYANDVLVSNCEFIIWEETLISPSHLIEIEGIEPCFKQGQVRWYQNPRPNQIYCVAWDPSLGTGSDPAAIQVYEANTTTQIAEWRHNRTVITEQLKILADIIRYINEKINDPTSIYYTVENNTIGEAALMAIADFGEENIPGIFLSEPSRAGGNRRYRKGFNTGAKSKLAACSKFKSLVESKKMKLHSKNLIGELKTFVANGASYAAKPGETDDLVMSTILVVRMMQYLQNYHAELNDQIRDYREEIEPMPIIIL